MPETLDIKLGSTELDLSQYFGLWAIEQNRFREMLKHLQSVDLSVHIAANKDRDTAAPPLEHIAQQGFDPETDTTVDAVIAVLSIDGTMTKRGSSYGAGASVMLRKEIREAANDKGIDAILLVIDSPGGTVAGTADLAAEVKAASAKKPIYCQVEDCCCSAAYWVASQAERVYANDRTALVGSIGTYMGVYDESEKFTVEGIKPVLIATGEHKGAGFPGTEITETQRTHFQDIVDQTQQSFSDAVSSGRQLSTEEVESLADGKVWLADKAVELRLIDGIQSRDATLSELASEVSKKRGSQQMAAATYEELKAECVGADARFICSQLDEKVELDQARKNWMAEQNRRLSNARRRAEEETDEEDEELAEEETDREERKRSKKSKKAKRSKSSGRKKRAEEPEDEDGEVAEDDTTDDEDEDDPVAEDEDDEDDDAFAEEDEEEETQSRHRHRRPRRRRGVEPLGKGRRRSVDYADPATAFQAAVEKKMQGGKVSRERAVSQVVSENPDLHEAYIRAHNRMYAKVRREGR